MFNTPVLFLVFNRPELTKRVFEQIRKIQPTFLYIAADGPRLNKQGEDKICAEVKNIILSNIDWDCEVKTLFREQNLGCGKAVSEAIAWFFEHVEEGIILEDDCLPDLSFFEYCESLLETYRHNENVFMISGDNFRFGNSTVKTSYTFSKYCNIWGWATWKRSWNLYSYKMEDWPVESARGILQAVLKNKDEVEYWEKAFNGFFEGKIDTWDYQLQYTCWKEKLLCVEPAVNLIMNIGFGEGATHLTESAETLKFGHQKHYSLKITDHPVNMEYDEIGDRVTFLNRYGDPLIRPFIRKNIIERMRDLLFRITHLF